MDKPPLTSKEIEALRNLLEADRRAKWLMSKVKSLAVWLSAVFGCFILVGDTIVKAVAILVKELFK